MSRRKLKIELDVVVDAQGKLYAREIPMILNNLAGRIKRSACPFKSSITLKDSCGEIVGTAWTEEV